MPTQDRLPYEESHAILVTRHGKEYAISPTLKRGLGLTVELESRIDTDKFGTFTGDISRTGTQLDAAKAKIEAGFGLVPSAQIAIASEGSFGPHPQIPFLSLAREIVVLTDKEKNLTLIGHYAGTETNYGNTIVSTVEEAVDFADTAHFPSHGLNVLGCRDNVPDTTLFLEKEIIDLQQLALSIERAVSLGGAAFIQTDMRAHKNPTRMQTIKRAAEDLVRLYSSQCPRCRTPGFDIVERVPGVPCSSCGHATSIIIKHILICATCSLREERNATSLKEVDPAQCGWCNP